MAGLLDSSSRLSSSSVSFQPFAAASVNPPREFPSSNPLGVRAKAVAQPPLAQEAAASATHLNNSSRVTLPKFQGGSQAILHGVGLTDEDLHKPQVGISSVWYEGNACNMHLLQLSEAVKEGVKDAGLVGFRFNTVGVSDANSTEGMCYSLQSRDLAADSIETMMGGQCYDTNISIPGFDKNVSLEYMKIGSTAPWVNRWLPASSSKKEYILENGSVNSEWRLNRVSVHISSTNDAIVGDATGPGVAGCTGADAQLFSDHGLVPKAVEAVKLHLEEKPLLTNFAGSN